jgi:uncharacterized protein (TIGR02996 family)
MPTYPLHGGHTPLDRDRVEAFLKSIASAPGNGVPRLMFSDYLDEHGFTNAAAGQRWAAREGKRPMPAGHRLTDNGPPNPGGWYPRSHFSSSLMAATGTFDAAQPHILPHPLFYEKHPHGYFLERTRPGESVSIANRDGRDPLANEADFLHASHNTGWHPETGEPIDPTTNE